MKNNLMKLLLCLFAFISISAAAQTQSNDWTLLKEEQGIKFYYKYADCDFTDIPDAQWVLLKIENTTDKILFVEWNLYNHFNGVCTLCKNDPNGEAHKELKLAANTSMQGDCISSCPKSLRIFSKFIEFKTEDLLTKFEIKDIIITEIKE